jgi:hypothetical protein
MKEISILIHAVKFAEGKEDHSVHIRVLSTAIKENVNPVSMKEY